MVQIKLVLIVLLVLLATSCSSIAQQITYCQPERFISCPEDVNQTCYIELTVANMQTLTAYSTKDSNCTRDPGSGYQVTINEEGDLMFNFPQVEMSLSSNQLLLMELLAESYLW